MSEEHKHLVNDLQKQLDAADIEISRLQRDQQKLQGLPVAPLPQDNAAPFDIFSQERQEGEVSVNFKFIANCKIPFFVQRWYQIDNSLGQ